MRPLAILLAAVTIAYAQQPKKRPAIPPKPAAAKPAEPKPAGPPAFLIESISFDGLKLYQPDQLIEFTGLKLGEPGVKAKFDAAQQKLADSGAFASVGYRYDPSRGGKGYAVTFEIAEVEQIYPIRFDDLPMSGKELRAALKKFDPLFNGKVPGTQAVVQRYANEIQQILKSEEAISGKLISEAPGELLIVFRPASAPLAIAEIEFTGNQAIPAATLRNTISGVAVGVAYSEPKMRLLLDSAVRPLYDQRGYVRLAFGKDRKSTRLNSSHSS